MNPSEINQLRLRYIKKIYELTGANTGRGANRELIDSELGITEELDMAILNYLTGKGLAGWHSPISAKITAEGIDEVEKAMEEQKMQALQKLYKLANQHTDFILVSDIAESLG